MSKRYQERLDELRKLDKELQTWHAEEESYRQYSPDEPPDMEPESTFDSPIHVDSFDMKPEWIKLNTGGMDVVYDARSESPYMLLTIGSFNMNYDSHGYTRDSTEIDGDNKRKHKVFMMIKHLFKIIHELNTSSERDISIVLSEFCQITEYANELASMLSTV
jgi:hypothetical protein